MLDEQSHAGNENLDPHHVKQYDYEENGWTRSDIEEHIRDEHSTYTWLLEPMIQRCGFAIEQTEYSEDSIFSKYVIRAI